MKIAAIPPGKRFKGRPGPKPKLDPARDFATLGAPPKDPLEAYVSALEALQVSLFHVINDPDLDERTRRKEMREIARAMTSLEPKARLFDAETRIRGDKAALDETEGGPEMEDAEEQPPEPGRAAPKRGRPRR